MEELEKSLESIVKQVREERGPGPIYSMEWMIDFCSYSEAEVMKRFIALHGERKWDELERWQTSNKRLRVTQ